MYYSIYVDVYVGVIDDIIIVPVNISYDIILEKNFVRHELMVRYHNIEFNIMWPLQGGSKKPETFWDTLRGAWSMLTTNVGSVRVDFAQPFSLQVRFINSQFVIAKHWLLQEYLTAGQVSNSSLLELSNLTRSRSVLNLVEHEQRRQITAASHHIVYGRDPSIY